MKNFEIFSQKFALVSWKFGLMNEKKSFSLFFFSGNRRPKIFIFWSVKMFFSSAREAEGAPRWLQLNYSAIKW